MLVVGIDPSLTGTGLVAWHDGKVIIAKTLKNHPNWDIIPRVLSIVEEISTEIGNIVDDIGWYLPPNMIVIEGFSYGSRGRGLFETAYLGYRIREELHVLNREMHIPWMEASPNELKKFVTGKVNATKDIMMQQVLKRWGYEAKDNNIADAYALAMIGVDYLCKS
jgi:crossover junction endodeoxyribonuclease RuvC